ncbi:MAG: ATP-binding domain-containing protein [Mollicutes bacterium]|nr:ATP-binding domain-containing protein [Mollicutes bacterium]
MYGDFFKSEYARIKLNDDEISYFIKRDKIFYEDALLFTFIKGLLESFNYQGEIKHVVIDEAQDYSKIQYIIIAKIFKSASLTILGDINQTINPYYQYESLNNLAELFGGSTCYLELTKSYRSSQEIIEYSNQILGLDHVSAIRIGKREPVIRKNAKVLREDLIEDINKLQKQYSSIAIITKDDLTATDVYEQIKNEFDVSLILESTMRFNKKLVVIPVYMAKGLEFDSVIVINKINNSFTKSDKYLMYVALTRAQHKLIIYN